jgi:hypothetical protein
MRDARDLRIERTLTGVPDRDDEGAGDDEQIGSDVA